MRRFVDRVSKKMGLPPGSAVHVGEHRTEPTRITIIDYDERGVREHVVSDVDACAPFLESNSVTWINVDGVHDVEIVRRLGALTGLHPLFVEDICNTTQRPKLEDEGDALFLVLKMLDADTNGDVSTEQVSLVLGRKFVVTFQEYQGDVFDAIRERIRGGKGRIRKMRADYLAYSIVDAIVDRYFLLMEQLGDRIELLEGNLVDSPGRETLATINRLKRELLFLRKSVWPLREVIDRLGRDEFTLIHKETRIYLRDVYDHAVQVIDTVSTMRDMVSGMLDIYLSSMSNRMNEVMKVLTIIATIFIPLTFIAGVYGMNFRHMPELEWHWAYPYTFWPLVLAIGGAMLFFFRRRKWL